MTESNRTNSDRSVPETREPAIEPGFPILSSARNASEQAPSQTRCALQIVLQSLGKGVLVGDLKESFSHTHFPPKESLGPYDQNQHQESKYDEITILRPYEARAHLFDHTNEDASE